MKRRLIQFCATSLYNLDLRGPAEMSIYKGKSKGLYVPGLNYYSCPEAVDSRPPGTLQNALFAMDRKFPFYILGILSLFGVTMGKTIYGFIYPFGLVRGLLYKISVSRVKENRITRELPRMKYVILAVFVIILSAVFKAAFDLPVPAFYKYICPAGTLEGRIPLMLLDESLGGLTGALSNWKVLVMAIILVGVCFVYRSFCQFLYPLGAICSPFAPAALLRVNIGRDVCTDCGRCMWAYKMDIRQVGSRECIQCSKCIEECNADTIYWKEP